MDVFLLEWFLFSQGHDPSQRGQIISSGCYCSWYWYSWWHFVSVAFDNAKKCQLQDPNGFGQDSQLSRHSKQTYGKQLRKTLLASLSGSSHRLKQTLGSWLNKPNQLWTHYYNTKRNRLLTSVTGSSGRLMYKYSSQPKRQSQKFATVSVLSNNIEITKDHITADVEGMNRWALFFYGIFSKLQVPIRLTPKPRTGKDYIKALPLARRRFLIGSKSLARLSLSQSIESLTQAIIQTGQLSSSTDGGMQDGRGLFGCVLANSAQPLWIGAGPTDMDPNIANLSRPEMAGYIGLWENILMLYNIYPHIFWTTPWRYSPGLTVQVLSIVSSNYHKRTHSPGLILLTLTLLLTYNGYGPKHPILLQK